MHKVSLISNSQEETKQCARRFSKQLKAGDIVFLQGQLGSGKTTFVKGVAQGLKVNPHKVSSPTFVLMNYYKGALPIYHFDLYRLENPQQLCTVDFDDYLYDQGVSLIEWSERLREKPETHYLVELQHKGEERRKICISYHLKPRVKSSR